jgi:uncharacterized protein (TIGR04141 family)
MKLTIYLLRESVTDLSSVILARYTEGGGYVEVRPTAELPFPCCAWLQRNKAKPPRWLEWLATAFDFEEDILVNQSNSFVLVLEAAGCRLAVTFGYGFNVIDRARVEPDFGLKVTLNIVDPQALDTLDTRTLDRVTKQTRTHLNVGRPVEEFGIEPDLDWLRSVRGTAKDEQITGKVQGSDAVRITWNGGLETLGDCCQTLLDLYQSENYKRYFGFVDHLCRLPTADPLVATLEKKVLRLLEQRDREWLTVAHPDLPSPDAETFKIWCGHTSIEDIDELDMDALFAFLDEYREKNGETPDLHKTWVIALDDQGEARSQKTALWKYLVVHVEHDSHIYVLSLGQWFRTDKDYVDELRTKVAAIEDVTKDFNCPPWPKGTSEKDYNNQLANIRGWLLLDREMFTFEEATNKIECADLLTPKQDFVHVKSMTSSATMSHLFAQGTVSARLFRTVHKYREKVATAFGHKYGSDFDMNSKSRVVYAIGTPKDGPIAENLFFFSLVNLVQHKETLDGMGLPVAVCRIKREGAD